jgi:serine/threonine protein kinase
MAAPAPASVCPTPELLAAFDRGELPADTADPVASHVEACPACQAALGALAAAPDPLLDGLRAAGQAAPWQAAATVLTGPPAGLTDLGPPGYELCEKVGSGGMGVVYRARDSRLNREVAVKLLRDDLPADSAVRARFVAEAQITGQLQHPGIPAVHELGSLPDGRPFLAMKLVKGRTLHELLKERPDPAHDRGRFVAIFEQVCQAVGYAHAHRVLHRDLKPGNVMVGAFGEVQVMDWGLAKVLASRDRQGAEEDGDDPPETVAALTAIDTPLAGDSATRTGAVMGTPAYMPPEQAGGEVRKLDARSDVFGLGAILCQVLTGQPPFSGQDANEVRLKAVRGEVQEALARLDGSGADPELVALCKRCLAFRQEDRPADGQAVAQEVARVRQAAEERARRAELQRAAALVREAEQRKRRRQLLTAAGLVAAALLAGIVGTTVGLLQARQAAEAERQAKRDAEDQKTKAEQAAKAEAAQRQQADAERALAQATNNFFIIDLLGQANPKLQGGPDHGPDRDLKLRTVLDRASIAIEKKYRDRPLVEAAIRQTIGRAYRELGEYSVARPHLERSLELRRQILGNDHPETVAAINDLAWLYRSYADSARAEPLFVEMLDWNRRTRGPEHAKTLSALTSLAALYRDRGVFAKAEPLFLEALETGRRVNGDEDRTTIYAIVNLGVLYYYQGDYARAEPLCVKGLEGRQRLLGDTHGDTQGAMYNLALVYLGEGQFTKAEPLLLQSLEWRRRAVGDTNYGTLLAKYHLAACYLGQGHYAKAEPLLREVLPICRQTHGDTNSLTLLTLAGLAEFHHQRGQLQEAEDLLRDWQKSHETEYADSWRSFFVRSLLGKALLDRARALLGRDKVAASEKLAAAEPLLLSGYEGLQSRAARIDFLYRPRILRDAVQWLVECYDASGNSDEAARWRKELAFRKEGTGSPEK